MRPLPDELLALLTLVAPLEPEPLELPEPLEVPEPLEPFGTHAASAREAATPRRAVVKKVFRTILDIC